MKPETQIKLIAKGTPALMQSFGIDHAERILKLQRRKMWEIHTDEPYVFKHGEILKKPKRSYGSKRNTGANKKSVKTSVDNKSSKPRKKVTVPHGATTGERKD